MKRYRFGFNGKENDNEVKGTGNQIDFGNRAYDPRLGRWLSLDKLASSYADFSPYNFALNTPIQAKDPDGNVVIFINGQHAGSGGTSAYWGGYDKKVMGIIGDQSARYVDGAFGGWSNTISSATKGFSTYGLVGSYLALVNSSNVSLNARKIAGAVQGYNDAADVISNLKDGESIKIVTHSMGTAFSRGYVKGLKKYARENDIKINIEYQLDVNAFQGGQLPADKQNVQITDNKTGSKDGGNSWADIINFNSVPSVDKVPGANDISSFSDKTKGHDISKMSTFRIPFLGNGGDKKSIEQKSNNEGTKVQ